MPKHTDINKILIIGSGPIIIGQACEFDYSGTQACKALMEEGYEVVLVNSNPATIMTDPETAHRTYIEPITPEIVAKIIERERPHAILPTLGGQTGLNTAVKVAETGLLVKLGVEMIGASIPVIRKAEEREQFRDAISHIGLRVPENGIARDMDQAREVAERIGYPLIIRASFTLGGTGSGVAYNREEMEDLAKAGLDASMVSEIIMEESLIGWKEYELEVMRDFKDNVVIICSIENFDPMGIHTGDSITVAPAQTLTDREYQAMRDAAIVIIREIGVETGGSNIQFAIHPENGEMVVIEMNPRVSRSSALASKATGFPIAKIAAKLAIGYTLKEMGIESIMVNSNPETVSTDYDISDKLYFEPLTREDILNIVEQERPEGIIVQFGGQTPLNISASLADAGVTILGTSPDSIDRAEDRDHFQALLKGLNIEQPENGIAINKEEAIRIADKIGYPVLVRPSFVLGGRAMEIVYDQEDLEFYMESAVRVSPGKPVLIDRFLEDATEIDVDAISDGEDTIIGGIMEHIEEAGIHSGDSACVLPSISLSREILEQIKEHTRAIARELDVRGLMNIQYAVKEGIVYVLEVNPRASRTVPFVSKATGVPLARLATKVIMGKRLKDLGLKQEVQPSHICCKESAFPFARFPNVDPILGPEMRSTGEVMGIDSSFGLAFAKSQLAVGQKLPLSGTVFISVKDKDKKASQGIAAMLHGAGFKIVATGGTSAFLFWTECISFRKTLGAALSNETAVDADLVMPFPDSGNYAAVGYAQATDMPLELAIIRNHYVGRTFIQPSQSMRDFEVRIKLNPAKEAIKGKKVVIIEDSVIRGTTTRTRIKAIRKAGAKEIILLVSCPPIRFPCYYGIDFPTTDELIAAKQSVEEIREFLNLDGLHYLDIKSMLKAAGGDSRRFCLACFNGEYPIPLDEFIGKLGLERPNAQKHNKD
jgi:carbamoylphosphate synthase large subunit